VYQLPQSTAPAAFSFASAIHSTCRLRLRFFCQTNRSRNLEPLSPGGKNQCRFRDTGVSAGGLHAAGVSPGARHPLPRPNRHAATTGLLTSGRILAKATAKYCLRDFPWLRVIDSVERFVLG
jgi:hypothetical protein